MKAFTHLCENVDISLMNDTITVYLKSEDEFKRSDHRAIIQRLDRHQFTLSTILQFERSVHQDDNDHELLHQDHFDRDKSHFHIKFNRPIDEDGFEAIMAFFEDSKLINVIEKNRIVSAYRGANLLDASPTPGVAPVLFTEESALTAALTSLELDLANKPRDVVVPTVFGPEESNLKMKLDALYTKVLDLELKRNVDPHHYTAAALAARSLYERLDNELTTYLQNKTKATYDVFKSKCSDAISEAMPVLQQHRGLKQIVGNILLAIGLLGIGYIAAGLVNLYRHDRFLFFKTDSENKVDAFATSLQDLPAPVEGSVFH